MPYTTGQYQAKLDPALIAPKLTSPCCTSPLLTSMKAKIEATVPSRGSQDPT
ncbi:MAG: hypothetical protein ABSB10_00400 [Candidatus Bathyarchaeia archaeon]